MDSEEIFKLMSSRSSIFSSEVKYYFILESPKFTTLEEESECGNSFTKTAAFKLARNRWFLAVMLIRNPSLRKYRVPRDYNDGVESIKNSEKGLPHDIV